VDTVLNLNAGGAGSLSAVLSAAAAGDTIEFAAGLHGTITPSATLTVANSVTIQGPGADVIAISGGGANQVFVINNGVSAAISGLTITDGSASDPNALGGAIDNEGNLALVGDVISNSTASATSGGDGYGGGIYSNGALSLVNCVVSGNKATADGGGNALGGGIFVRSGVPVLSISGCTITGNQATSNSSEAQGGGLWDGSQTDSIVNTVFSANSVSAAGDLLVRNGFGAGGGAYFTGGNTTLTNLTFSGNTVSMTGSGFAVGGGGFDYEGSFGTFTNVNVTDNMASTTGNNSLAGGGASLLGAVNWTGGLVSGNTATSSGSSDVGGGGIWIDNKVTLTGLTVTGNTTSNTGSGDAEGGGIVTENTTVLNACTVSGNNATANSSVGAGGGIATFAGLTVTASTIANNSASSTTGDAYGGGIVANLGDLAVTNTTLFGNSVTAPAGTAEGGGLFNGFTLPTPLPNLGGTTLSNDTLASNTATGGTAKGGGIFNSSGNTVNLVNTIVYDPSGVSTDPDVSGTITATHNSLYGSAVAAQIAANGNLGGNQFSTNPMLDPNGLQNNGGPTQTLALLPGSPALGAGTNTSALGGIPTTDQRGLPRPGPDGFDLGAFQTQPPPSTPSSQPQADPSMPPQVLAFLVPAPRGQIAVSGFVLDPSGVLAGLPLAVVINWGNGTTTFTALVPGAGGFDFFLPQRHKKPKGHKPVTVQVQRFVLGSAQFVDVVTPFTIAT
jgi:hypothetical protein